MGMKKRAKAFTLMELILVMVIICILLATAAPSLRGFFSSHQLSDLAELITVSARYARLQAISSSAPCRLVIDTSDNKYWVSSDSSLIDEQLKNSLGQKKNIPSDLVFKFEGLSQENTCYYVEFDSLGNCSESSIEILDFNGNEFIIEFWGGAQDISFRETQDSLEGSKK